MTAPAVRVPPQPSLGLAGITLVMPVAVALAAGLRGLEPSLLVLGPISTFALPVIAMVAFWWNDWPGTRLRAPLVGITDTLLVAAGGVALTAAAQAVVAHLDLHGVFDPAAAASQAPTFPATMTLGGAVFVAMLQVTLVCEGWPLRGLGPITGGLLAFAAGWAAGLALYFSLVRSRLVPGLGGVLVCIGALQVVVYVVLRGEPFVRIAPRAPRLAVANAVVIAGGWLASLVVAPAVAGCVVAAGLTVGMLFEGWLGSPAANLVAVALLSALLYAGLEAIAGSGSWTRAEPEEWTAHATLNAIGAGVILHVAIGRRWPFAACQA